jgi:phosphoribosyl-ATP pyrophosphohydrolase/phosphoribosyl-AMP cyclohydrolase
VQREALIEPHGRAREPGPPVPSARIERMDAPVRFDEDGLVPCVMQDARTGEVLTLAYMNEEALRRTRETGEVHFWSRSRNQLWRKGESSGNVMRLRALRFDCDEDAILALVDPAGPACHTGERSCFHRGDMERTEAEALAALERTVAKRRTADPGGSYTAELLANRPRIGEKVREEADEVARAADDEPDERVGEEAADVLYHLTVLLASRELELGDALEVLNRRARG